MEITHYTLQEYNKAIELHKNGLGSQRIAKILGYKCRSVVEEWINRGRKPYYFSDKRIAASNSKANIERMRAMNKITQPKACKIAAELNTKKLKTKYKLLTKELAYILGVIYGDGHVSIKQRRVILSAIDKDFVLNFKENLEKWSGFKTRFYLRNLKLSKLIKRRKPQWVCYIDSIEAAKFLKKFNRDNIKYCNKVIKYEFIKGMFDSEGSVTLDGSIHIYNSDKSLINFVNKLINNLGIKTSLLSRTCINNLTLKPITMYKISILGETRKHFAKEIGSSIERKKERLVRFINN